jgi:two-component system chemotaxis response regulator CheB
MIRAVIVDQSRLMREMLHGALEADGTIQVVGVAADPNEARSLIRNTNPDVVTLDVEMPQMDGLEFLENMMRLRPVPVVMVASRTVMGAENTLRALELGAVEFIAKPVGRAGWNHFAEAIRRKVRDAAGARTAASSRPGLASMQALPGPLANALGRYEVIAIGASTGGVAAIHRLLVSVPPSAPPIVIAQHMPPYFTARFAERLAGATMLECAEAAQGDLLGRGQIRIAPGDRHLRVVREAGRLACELGDDPTVSGHRPSVDLLFDSVAAAAGRRALGIILTGMGKDGAKGLLRMREAGAVTVAEAERSCVVYGMPKAAKELGAVCLEAGLDEIVEQLHGPTASTGVA